jgi:hypothetical protein
MAFAAEARQAEGQFQHLKSKVSNIKSQKFQSGMSRPNG